MDISVDQNPGMVIFGTRPEAIKLLTVIQEIRKLAGHNSVYVCCTGQHKNLIDDTNESIKLDVDQNFQIMEKDQTPATIIEKVLFFTTKEIERIRPKWILVHGDTATTMGGALAGFHAQVRVIHLEAGLRTYNKSSPWPEEGIRQAVSKLADIHLAPTPQARKNLLSERINSDDIKIVGNPGADLLYVDERIPNRNSRFLEGDQKQILVTIHRRENQGEHLTEILNALINVSLNIKNIKILFVMHPNPKVRSQIEKHTSSFNGDKLRNMSFVNPLPYREFQAEFRNSHLLVTDSGGLQEEAALLGIPCIIARDTTERPEIVELGLARMVSINSVSIFSLIEEMIEIQLELEKVNTWRKLQGEGKAGSNTARAILKAFPPD